MKDPFGNRPAGAPATPIPYYAQALHRYPPGANHGFPHPGFMGSNSVLEHGRGFNPFREGGPPEGSAFGRGAIPVEISPEAPLPLGGGFSKESSSANTIEALDDDPERFADMRAPFAASSQIGKSSDLLPGETDTLVRVFTRTKSKPTGIAIHYAVRPTQAFGGADTFNGQIIATFGSGGVQLPALLLDIGCGSTPSIAAGMTTSLVDVGGFGGSVILPGNFVNIVANNTGTSPTNNRTTFMAMATATETTRNPQPVRITQYATIASGGATTFAIPPYASDFIVLRTNNGVTPFLVQVFRFLGAATSTYDEPVLAGERMAWAPLTSGAFSLGVTNMGAVACAFSVLYRLNI